MFKAIIIMGSNVVKMILRGMKKVRRRGRNLIKEVKEMEGLILDIVKKIMGMIRKIVMMGLW